MCTNRIPNRPPNQNRAQRRRAMAMRRRFAWQARSFRPGSVTVSVTPAAFAAILAAKGEPYRWLPCGCVLFRCPCCGDWSATFGDGSCLLGGPEDERHRWLCQEFAPAGGRERERG